MLGYEKDDMRLLKTLTLPGGFCIYSRKAFEMVQNKVRKYKNVCLSDRMNGDDTSPTYYEYFRADISDSVVGGIGSFISEDVYFQTKYYQAGGTIYVEPRVTFWHWGVKDWMGSLHEHLLKQKTLVELKEV